MSKWLEQARLIHPTLEHDPEDIKWEVFVEAASLCDAEDIASLLDEVLREKTHIKELEARLDVVRDIKWKSADKDNMEFTTTITYYQREKLQVALKESHE